MEVTIKDVIKALTAIEEETEVLDDSVFIPALDLLIKPTLAPVNTGENFTTATVHFWVTGSPLGEEPFIESATGAGKTPHDAVQQAMTSFMLGAMCGLRHFAKGEMEYTLTSEFAGVQRSWAAVGCCGVVMGKRPANLPVVWELIQEMMSSRLGGRAVYYVKTYAAKQADGETIGEVRINNQVDAELSAALAQNAKEWDNEGGFASQKEFFFFRQDAATVLPYPHSRSALKEYVGQAVALFSTAQDNDDYVDTLTAQIGDRDLAVELHSFLPEMCAERAFQELRYGDSLQVDTGSGQPVTVYKSQLYSYFTVKTLLFDGFAEGLFTNEDYKTMVGWSATLSVYNQVMEACEQGKLKREDIPGVSIALTTSVPEDYQLR